MQAAINAAGNLLPADLPAPPIYAKVNPADAPILTLGVDFEDDEAHRRRGHDREPRSCRSCRSCPASAWCRSRAASGPPCASTPIRWRWRPTALNLDDLRTTIANLNVNTPKGNFDGPAQSSAINANDQIRDPNDYLEIRSSPIATARRSGCATSPRSRSAPENDQLVGLDEHDAGADRQHPAPARRQRHPGRRQHQEAAAAAAATRCRRRSTITPLTDRTTTIRASVEDVEFELSLAVGLVVLVIFLFLRNIPATIIPSLSVPLSLVGALAIMYGSASASTISR